MRSLVSPFLLIAALMTSGPVGAQIAGRPPYEPVRTPNPFIGDSRLPGPPIGRDLGDVRDRVDRARENGTLSKREARRLDREARHIARLARRYGRDGLSDSERQELEVRTRYLRDAANRPASQARAPRKGSGR